MITLVWRSDVHLADQPPQSRIDDWTETILEKLNQVEMLAREVNADAVLDGGDFFHVKSPGRNTHELVRRAVEAHRQYPCPVYACIGNHDVKYGSMEFLPESPLAVLYETGVFKRLYDQHEALFEKNGVTVRVVGIPYHGSVYDWNRFTTITKGKEDYLVVVAHCFANEKGGTLFEAESVLDYRRLLQLDPTIFCFGHWHKDQGIKKVGDKWIVNLGSLSRGTIGQDDVDHKPACAVLKFTKTGVTVDRHPLKIRPAKEVLDLARHERAETCKASVETVVDRLREVLSKRTTGSLLDEVRNLPDIPDVVRERTIGYLEKAGAR